MAFMDTPAKRQQGFWYFGASLLLLSLLAFPVVKIIADPGPPDAGADETTTTTAAAPAPAGGCGVNQVFFSRFTEGNQFGLPASETDVEVAHGEFASARCQDAMLFVADEEYLFNQFTDPATRVQKTIDLMANPQEWANREANFMAKLNEARKEIVEMSGRYQTMDAEDKGRTIPEVYQIPVEAAAFKVIRYTWPDGTVKQFKLNCGFQPVEQSFPSSVPGVGAPPAPNQPSAPPVAPAPAPPGKPGKPTTTTTPTTPTTVPKCSGSGTCGTPHSGPDSIVPEPLPPTPGYEPGGAEGSASDPGDGVFPQGGSMSGGESSEGGGTETGGTTGFGDIAPTELTPEPAASPGNPGMP